MRNLQKGDVIQLERKAGLVLKAQGPNGCVRGIAGFVLFQRAASAGGCARCGLVHRCRLGRLIELRDHDSSHDEWASTCSHRSPRPQGYYIVDQPLLRPGKPLVLLNIPDGRQQKS